MPITGEPVPDSEELYRWVCDEHIYPESGEVKSVHFRRNGKPDPEISVDVASLTSIERSMAPWVGRKRQYRLGILETLPVRKLGLEVVHDPIPKGNPHGTPENDAHALIKGATKAHCAQLAELISRRMTEHIALPASTEETTGQ